MISQSKMDELQEDSSEASADLDDSTSKGSSCSRGKDGFSTSGADDTGNSSSAGDDDINAIKDALARQETKAVFRLRIMVLFLLLAVASSVAYTVFHIIRSAQLENFEADFYAVSEKIIVSLNHITDSLSSVAGLAVTVSSNARMGLAAEEQAQWPFVTMTDFQDRALTARGLSGSLYLSVNPVVNTTTLSQWEDYVLSDANSWIAEGLDRQENAGLINFVDSDIVEDSFITNRTVDPLYTYDADGKPYLTKSEGPIFVPRWQTSPVLAASKVNENLLEGWVKAEIQESIDTASVVLGGFHYAPPGDTSSSDITTNFFAYILSMWEGKRTAYEGDPISHIVLPIFDKLSGDNRNVVGVLKSTIQWKYFLQEILTESDIGYNVEITSTCLEEDSSFTFQLNGPRVTSLGVGDYREDYLRDFSSVGSFTTDVIDDGTVNGVQFSQEFCPYTFEIYPTTADYQRYVTREPLVISLSITAVFIFTIFMFLVYDRLVERRQRIVLAKATQSTAIVSSLFPKQVRDRLLAVENEKSEKRKGEVMMTGNHKLKSFLNGNGAPNAVQDANPIADLFPNCTVLFADIAGFTAWSSSREPSQVFVLLQTLYQSFDNIAKRRKVFKVETIGDSYVAVTGLPEAQPRHATIMARFAWDCLHAMREVTTSLENRLGPDTAELSMRFGMHSGPVTAGVLKGDRARFQLFGDTVNTAARMESTGEKGRIQISSSTAALLRADRHGQWISARADTVTAKGKGVMSTFWLTLKTNMNTSSDARSESGTSLSGSSCDEFSTPFSEKLTDKKIRLTDWIADLLIQQIKKLVIVRERCSTNNGDSEVYFENDPNSICLDEVQQAIQTPDFDRAVTEAALDSELVQVPADIIESVQQYVSLIAKTYRSKNWFHNFEHACHVTMSVSKLLGRVVTPDLSSMEQTDKSTMAANPAERHKIASKIHDLTHGLTSDPMASFALIFSALIHDADHQGVSNTQLAKEEPDLAIHYRYKSVAEQNSLDIAWDILMGDRFEQLREYVFGTQQELLRFRQLTVNIVLATDIFDKELNQLRKDRWQMAFHEGRDMTETKDLRATIVMEHIMQASDVSHTMQHWHVYQKWNQRLFLEMREAYQAGRMGADPATFWYQGELGFFDNYIIPLAKKLKECNVFGVSSDEYLNYAMKNREEWEQRGMDIVSSMMTE